MAEVEDPGGGDQVAAPKRKGKLGLIVGLVLALALGGGGFYAVYSGLVLGSHDAAETAGAGYAGPGEDLPPIAFVALDPLVVSLGTGAQNRHLRFRAELEVAPDAVAEVTKLIPRVMDVLNSYLRAVELADLENAAALITLRAQMLRRIQLVTGEGRVRDLLIMEFVMN
jgi:flagellar FliL protein